MAHRAMVFLIEWTTKALSNRALHPLLVIAVFVVVFLEIHPFQDGNGPKVEREKKILGQLPELSLRIYELTKERGQVKVEDIVRTTSAARGTVKDHLNHLIKDGYLVQHGKGKGTWYSLLAGRRNGHVLAFELPTSGILPQ